MGAQSFFERIRRLWYPRTILPFIMIAAMIAISQLVNSTVAIFPEAAALSLGTLTLQKQSWKSSKPKLVILPTVAAAAGVSMVALGIPTLVGAPLLLIIIVVVLHLLDSELLPTISAGVLPIVFRISNPRFLVTVLLVVGSIATISWLIDALEANRTQNEHGHQASSNHVPPAALLRFLIVIIPWIFLARATLPLPAIAPPLFVAIYEWYSRDQRRLSTGMKRWVVTVVAASLGELSTHVGLGVVGVVVAEILLLALMAGIDSIDPPAMAILLLPWIVRTISPVTFIVAIAVASLVLYGLGLEFPLWSDESLVRLSHRVFAKPPGVEP